jgi:hypothetical protein
MMCKTSGSGMDITRKRLRVFWLALSLACIAYGSAAQANCCEHVTELVWVNGRYSNAAAGDVVVNYVDSSSLIAPIIDALGESYSHSMLVVDDFGRVTHNVGDVASIEKGWTCSHPLNPYQLRPMAPGAQSYVYPDTNYDNFKNGTVLHGAGTPGCYVNALGEPNGVGYDLWGFSNNVTNGMCVELLNDSCGVARPSPRYYDPDTVASAVSAMYNAIYTQAVAARPWISAALGYCSGGSRYAANQVVNSFLYGNPWDTDFEPWNIAVSDVVTPAQLVATYPMAKEPVGLIPGYYVEHEVRRCHTGVCY